MEKTINEKLIKFSGKAAINFPVEIDDDVEVIVSGSCVKSEMLSNQDGSYDRVCVIKILEVKKVN